MPKSMAKSAGKKTDKKADKKKPKEKATKPKPKQAAEPQLRYIISRKMSDYLESQGFKKLREHFSETALQTLFTFEDSPEILEAIRQYCIKTGQINGKKTD